MTSGFIPKAAQPDPFEQFVDPDGQPAAFHPEELTVQGQELAGGQPILEAEVLRQEADAGPCATIPERRSQQAGRTGSRRDQSYQHLDRGGFSGPVRAQESKHLTLLDLQGEALYGGVVAEYFS